MPQGKYLRSVYISYDGEGPKSLSSYIRFGDLSGVYFKRQDEMSYSRANYLPVSDLSNAHKSDVWLNFYLID